MSVEYNDHSPQNVAQLSNWLFFYCFHRPTLPKYVRTSILRAAVTLFKRLAMDAHDSQSADVTLFVKNMQEQVITNQNEAYVVISLACFDSLLEEFDMNKDSSNLKLAYELHGRAHALFTESCLSHVWNTTLKILHTCITKNTAFKEDALEIAVEISKKVLLWQFGVDFRDVDPEAIIVPLWPASWKNAMNESIVELFFHVYVHIQEYSSNTINSTRQILLYLAELRFDDQTNLAPYFFRPLSLSLKELKHSQINEIGPHTYNLSEICRLVVSNSSSTDQIKQIMNDIVQAWIWVTGNLKGHEEEDTWWRDSWKEFAYIWLNSGQADQKIAELMFEKYLKAKLDSSTNSLDWDFNGVHDCIDQDDKDFDEFEEDLMLLGKLCVNNMVLIQMMKERMDMYLSIEDISDPRNERLHSVLSEHIHWLVLVSGFVNLTDDIVATIFNFSAHCNPTWSPQVVETIWWFTSKCGRFLFDPKLADFLMRKMVHDFKAWKGEKEIISQIATTLSILSQDHNVCNMICGTTSAGELIHLIGHINEYPVDLHAKMVESFTRLAGMHGSLQTVFDSVTKMMNKVFSIQGFERGAFNSVQMERVLDCTEVLRGVVCSGQPVFSFLIRFLDQLIKFTGMVHDMSLLAMPICKLFAEISKINMQTDEERAAFNALFRSLFETYSKCPDDDWSDEDHHLIYSLRIVETLQDEFGYFVVLKKLDKRLAEYPDICTAYARVLPKILPKLATNQAQGVDDHTIECVKIVCNQPSNISVYFYQAAAFCPDPRIVDLVVNAMIFSMNSDLMEQACKALVALVQMNPEAYQQSLNGVMNHYTGNATARLQQALIEFTDALPRNPTTQLAVIRGLVRVK